MAAIVETRVLYRGWTALLRLTIEDGASRYFREVEDHGNAAAVLPFDPRRRKALLVRLLRGPMLLAGGDGMSLEAPAGLVDSGTFEDTAKREALEETGLRLGAVSHVATVWTSPGITTERMGLFLAEYGAGDRVAEGGGIAEEHAVVPRHDEALVAADPVVETLDQIAELLANRPCEPLRVATGGIEGEDHQRPCLAAERNAKFGVFGPLRRRMFLQHDLHVRPPDVIHHIRSHRLTLA